MDVIEIVKSLRSERTLEEIQLIFQSKPQLIEKLVCLIENQAQYPLQEYASWILIHICKNQKELVSPYYKRLVACLFVNKNQSTLRNVTNLIHLLYVQPYREGDLMDLLLSFIQDYSNKVALQVYSMRILAQLVNKYPELKPEILEVIELHAENKSAAYHAGKRNFLKLTQKC